VDRGTSIRLIERVVILGPVAEMIEGVGVVRLTAPLWIEGTGMRLIERVVILGPVAEMIEGVGVVRLIGGAPA
jgi:hypothetical protein